MVTKRKQHSSRRPVKQGPGARAPRPNKIGAATPYHFRGKNLTPYGGLLPVATLLEKLGFQALLEETLTTKRITRAMSPYQFVLALVLGLYVGFARLNQLRFCLSVVVQGAPDDHWPTGTHCLRRDGTREEPDP